MLLTGQRKIEVLHLRREHIVDGWWQMPGQPVPELNWPGTKNGASHRVWLTQPVLDLLNDLDGPQPFAKSGKISNAMIAICKKLNVERATPHDLRRTFSTKVTALRFGKDAMNRVTNHREGGIASIYDRHDYAEENKTVMETVANCIMLLVSNKESNVVTLKKLNK